MAGSDTVAEVLVVGGGPVGLAAAALIGRLGHPVTVLEARSAPVSEDESRAITWMPEGLLLADRLGITGDLRAAAVVRTVHDFRRSADGPAILTLRLDRLQHRHPYSLNLAQHHSEVALTQAFLETPGASLIRGFTVTDVRHSDESVAVTGVAPDGRTTTLRARYGVIADGAASTRRGAAALLGIGQRFRDYGAFSAVADVELATDPDRNDRSWVALEPRRPIGAFAFGARRWRFIYRLNPGESRTAVVDPSFVDGILRRAYPMAQIRRHLWTSTFRLGQGQAEGFSAGRWVLVGDAAHAMGPSAGAGMMVGLLGAWRLETALRRNGLAAWDTAVAEYEDRQRGVARRVQRSNALVFRNLAVRNVPIAAVRSFGLGTAGRLGAVSARITRNETLVGLAPQEPEAEHAPQPH